jgi:hypothetical protein
VLVGSVAVDCNICIYVVVGRDSDSVDIFKDVLEMPVVCDAGMVEAS